MSNPYEYADTQLDRDSPMLELIGVTKSFFTDELEIQALCSVSLLIERGEFIVIEGPSGSGKSTLLAILGLLTRPTSGEYRLDGQPTTMLNRSASSALRSAKIGFIFQSFNLIADLTVAENVALPLAYRGISPHERSERALSTLDQVNMTARANHFPAQLSGGQQQRAAVARAIAAGAEVLLADEPTGNLDSSNGEAVMELLQTLNLAGTTVCMVSHDPRYTGLGSRSVHLFDGEIV